MGVNIAGRGEPHHLRQKRFVFGDQIHRDDTCTQDFLTVVDVMQKHVDRTHALFDPFGQLRPFAVGNDARDKIERDQPLLRRLLAVHVEGDPRAPEERLCLLRLLAQARGVLFGKPLLVFAVRVAHAVRAL